MSVTIARSLMLVLAILSTVALGGCTATDLIKVKQAGQQTLARSLEAQRAHTDLERRVVSLAVESFLSEARGLERQDKFQASREVYTALLSFLRESRPKLVTEIVIRKARALRDE